MILATVAGTTRTLPEHDQHPTQGRPIVIILERDGSLHHYPPDHPPMQGGHGIITLNETEAQPSLIERLIEWTFGRLKLQSLEMRIHEQPER